MRADLDWYHSESERHSDSTLRCPYAAVDKCPRYFESLALAENVGGCSMDPQLEQQMAAHWKDKSVVTATGDTAPSVLSHSGEFSIISNFCPEVTFAIRGYFASFLSSFTDEIDRDASHRMLSKQGASVNDPRWSYMDVIPVHYRACPTFAVLRTADRDTAKRSDLVEFKPGVGGLNLNVNELFRRLKEWYLRQK